METVLGAEIERAKAIRYALQPTSALVINNYRALHCRDIIQNNRKLLVRLFGYAEHIEPIILKDAPLIAKG